jgi:hypothetical protein
MQWSFLSPGRRSFLAYTWLSNLRLEKEKRLRLYTVSRSNDGSANIGPLIASSVWNWADCIFRSYSWYYSERSCLLQGIYTSFMLPLFVDAINSKCASTSKYAKYRCHGSWVIWKRLANLHQPMKNGDAFVAHFSGDMHDQHALWPNGRRCYGKDRLTEDQEHVMGLWQNEDSKLLCQRCCTFWNAWALLNP